MQKFTSIRMRERESLASSVFLPLKLLGKERESESGKVVVVVVVGKMDNEASRGQIFLLSQRETRQVHLLEQIEQSVQGNLFWSP